MKKENKKIIIFIVIIVVVLLLGVLTFMIINKDKEEIKENNEETSKPTNELVIEDTITEESAEAYLYYVPDLSEPINGDSIEHYGYQKDAYSGELETKDTLDERLLMKKVYDFSEDVESVEKVVTESCPEGCEADGLVLASEFNKNLKELYNIDKVTNTKFGVPGGIVELADKYYALWMGSGSMYFKKKSNMIKYEKVNDELIIYEKAGFVFEKEENGNITYVVSKTSDGKEIVKEKTYKEDEYDEEEEKYVIDHINEFYTFKHTFKSHGNNNFYWYSTEVEK